MYKLDANDIVGTTFFTINKIREYKNGGDMLILYFSYIEQSRIQQTNITRSLDAFMEKKLSWGIKRIRSAKEWLKELWLIDVIQGKDKEGKFETKYIKTNFLINEQKIRTNSVTYEMNCDLPESAVERPTVSPSDGQSTTNALSIKKKCLKNGKEKGVIILPPWQTEKKSSEKNDILSEEISEFRDVGKEATQTWHLKKNISNNGVTLWEDLDAWVSYWLLSPNIVPTIEELARVVLWFGKNLTWYEVCNAEPFLRNIEKSMASGYKFEHLIKAMWRNQHNQYTMGLKPWYTFHWNIKMLFDKYKEYIQRGVDTQVDIAPTQAELNLLQKIKFLLPNRDENANFWRTTTAEFSSDEINRRAERILFGN